MKRRGFLGLLGAVALPIPTDAPQPALNAVPLPPPVQITVNVNRPDEPRHRAPPDRCGHGGASAASAATAMRVTDPASPAIS